MFAKMRVNKYQFKGRALEELDLPAYKGATLRGGFGHALKRVVCALKRQDCGECLLRDRCVYVYLFETPPPEDTEMMRLYPAAPHPFVIEPPPDDLRTVPAGEPLDFGLVLVGNAADYLPYFVYAFNLLGEQGIGRERGRFLLEEVHTSSPDGSTRVYSHEDGVLRRGTPFPTWEDIRSRCEAISDVRALTFHFHTPTRIKADDRFVRVPEFHHVMRSLLRRLSSLSYFHCGTRLETDFKGLTESARKIERLSSDLHWYDWERYSSRQKQRMNLGGFVGSATFAGDFREFLPFLAWGEVLHVGKAASFGLGRYEMSLYHG
jgi:hypothetical protein